MGCLGCLGFLLEFIFESIVEGYFALMQGIVPKRWIGQHFQTTLKVIVGIFTGLLLVVMVLGFFCPDFRGCRYQKSWTIYGIHSTRYKCCSNSFWNHSAYYHKKKVITMRRSLLCVLSHKF